MTTKICHWIILVGLAAAFAACSSSQTSEEEAYNEVILTTEAGTDEVPPDPGVPPSAPGEVPYVEADPAALDAVAQPDPAQTEVAQVPTAPTEVPPGETPSAAPIVAAPPVQEEPSVANTTEFSEIPGTYTVQQGDTLMKIAFENYGDLFKWRSIYDANREKVKNPNYVPPGTVLTLDTSVMPVSVSRNGDQYVIKTGDTLGTISDDVYGTQRKWRRLWENNRELIRDPNRIFAGFSLYYTFTDEDRTEYEQLKQQNRSAPLAKAAQSETVEPVQDHQAPTSPVANAAGADQNAPRTPASVGDAPQWPPRTN